MAARPIRSRRPRAAENAPEPQRKSALARLFQELQARLDASPRKQQRVARALQQNPEAFAFGSVRELALQLGVNSITVLRFAQALGYTGYQPLQAEVRRAYLLDAGLQAPVEPLLVADHTGAVASTLAQQQANEDSLRRHAGEPELARFCDALDRATRVYVCGSGSAGLVGAYLVRLLRHVGLVAQTIASSGQDLAFAAYDLTSSDAVVGIGLWLTFRDVQEVLKLARGKGATTLALVGSPMSPLGDVADLTLLAPSQGAPLLFSIVAPIAAVELLAAGLAARRPDRVATINEALHDLYLEMGLLTQL